jgi:tellurite resistance protein
VTATALLLGEISNLERRAGVELGWFRRQLPSAADEVLLKQRLRTLRAVESMRLWTESAFAAAQISGVFLASLQEEAKGSVATSIRGAGQASQNSAEDLVLDTVLAIAAIDGSVGDREVSVIVETLRRMFGRAPVPALEAAVRARPALSAIPFDRLEETLSPHQRQLLLLQMAEVAAADGVVTQGESEVLNAFAARLHLPPAFVDAVLGGHLARADVAAAATPAPVPLVSTCPACAFDTPSGASFCPSCGAKLR